MIKIQVKNIKWDTDGEKIDYLPKEFEYIDPTIEIMEDYFNGNYESISDNLSDSYGYCHFGFDLKMVVYGDDDNEEIMNVISGARDDIHSLESMEDMVIDDVNNGNYNVAAHILNAMWENHADWYKYDRSMGTLETPTSINTAGDINALIEEM